MEDYPKKMLCVKVSLSIICPGCNGLIPINGPVSKVKCIRCGTEVNLEGEKFGWHKLLYLGNPGMTIFKSSLWNETNTGAFHSIKLAYNNEWPKCSDCEHTFSKDDFKQEDIKKNKLICPDCGKIKNICKSPQIIARSFSTVLYIIDSILDILNKGYPEITCKSEGTSPATFYCSSCGGGLHVDGTKRIISCEFCGSDNFIPDKLWETLYSTPKVKPWYIVFDREKL